MTDGNNLDSEGILYTLTLNAIYLANTFTSILGGKQKPSKVRI